MAEEEGALDVLELESKSMDAFTNIVEQYISAGFFLSSQLFTRSFYDMVPEVDSIVQEADFKERFSLAFKSADRASIFPYANSVPEDKYDRLNCAIFELLRKTEVVDMAESIGPDLQFSLRQKKDVEVVKGYFTSPLITLYTTILIIQYCDAANPASERYIPQLKIDAPRIQLYVNLINESLPELLSNMRERSLRKLSKG